MATGILLHHPLPPRHHRPALHFAESRYLHRRSLLRRSPFGLHDRCRTSTPSFLMCSKQDEQSGAIASLDSTEAVQWVNKEVRHPSVEVDPATVLRHIFRERQSMSREMEQADSAVQSTSPAPPPSFGIRRTCNSPMAIATVIFVLAIAGVIYIFRSTGYSKMTNTLTDAYSSLEPRRKLVKETIMAPDSVLTAMAIGAALVGRPKAQQEMPLTASVKGAESGQTPEGDTELGVDISAVFMDAMGSESNGASNEKGYGSDVTEEPWFSESPVKLMPAQAEKPERPEAVLADSQGLESVCVATTMPVVDQSISKMTASEDIPMVDGEFFGEVVSVNVGIEPLAESKIDSYESEMSNIILPDNDRVVETIEQILDQDMVTELENGSTITSSVCLEQSLTAANLLANVSAMDSAVCQSNSDTEVFNSTSGYSDIDQSFNPKLENEVSSTAASKEGRFSIEGVMCLIEGQSSGQALDMTLPDQEDSFFLVDQDIESAIQDSNALEESVGFQLEGHVEEKGPLICEEDLDRRVVTDDEEELTDGCVSLNQVHLQVSAAESNSLESMDSAVEAARREQDKALEAVVPALAIGLGTVGALFGVAGGLQVVGFAALASFISNEFFWAQSRESLWEEMRGITDHQKLLDFLARRNIVRREQEKTSL